MNGNAQSVAFPWALMARSHNLNPMNVFGETVEAREPCSRTPCQWCPGVHLHLSSPAILLLDLEIGTRSRDWLVDDHVV